MDIKFHIQEIGQEPELVIRDGLIEVMMDTFYIAPQATVARRVGIFIGLSRAAARPNTEPFNCDDCVPELECHRCLIDRAFHPEKGWPSR